MSKVGRIDKDEFEIIEDDWSGLKHKYRDHITILGLAKTKTTKTKLGSYILECPQCAIKYGEDFRYFIITKSALERGRVPCECVTRPRSEQELMDFAKQLCENKGISFIDWNGEFRGKNSKCVLLCCKHGIWGSTILSSIEIRDTTGCYECGLELVNNAQYKRAVDSFMSTGRFPKGTVFERTESTGTNAAKYSVYCPVCEESNISWGPNLQKGCVPCSCATIIKPTFTYIILISDKDIPIALKFGISNNPSMRFLNLKVGCIYDMKMIEIWEFESHKNAYAAEKTCKDMYSQYILPTTELASGYTEVTNTSNLENLREIFIKFGGIKN